MLTGLPIFAQPVDPPGANFSAITLPETFPVPVTCPIRAVLVAVDSKRSLPAVFNVPFESVKSVEMFKLSPKVTLPLEVLFKVRLLSVFELSDA